MICAPRQHSLLGLELQRSAVRTILYLVGACMDTSKKAADYACASRNLYKHYALAGVHWYLVCIRSCGLANPLLYLRVCGYFINQILCEIGGIGIQDAHPLQPI